MTIMSGFLSIFSTKEGFKMKSRVFILSAFTILWVIGLKAQAPFSIQISKNKFMLGEKIPVHIGINTGNAPDSISFDLKPMRKDTSQNRASFKTDFELSDPGKWKANGRFSVITDPKIKSNQIYLIVWDTGKFNLKVNKYLGAKPVKYLGERDSLVLEVSSGLATQDTSQVLAPIKDIEKEKKLLLDYLDFKTLMILGVIFISMVSFIIYYFRTNKKSVNIPKPVEKQLPAHIIALNRLNNLQTTKLWTIGHEKEYQEELTNTIKEFLKNRFYINALEQNTTELRSSLQKLQIDQIHRDVINEILNISDLVKFAKAKNDDNINERFLLRAIDLVNELKSESNIEDVVLK